ncbi:hypothetical protein [Maribacter arcticus]|jgi:hypothetical protein|uniref:Uncharacterized protein n=1 Tax=Maribacter arcticus TaxID=561365 RepID=A0A1T5CNJ9_9FLAO|nr:hypothetical protein [Maribacter arcticus]SKB61029.1 hypothetical protein SAMN05660866_02343 [Maribacter arcticus]
MIEIAGIWKIKSSSKRIVFHESHNHTGESILWNMEKMTLEIEKNSEDFYIFNLKGVASLQFADNKKRFVAEYQKTIVRIEKGFFIHHNYWSREFIFKKAIINQTRNSFSTEINDMMVTFEKNLTS